MPSKETLQSIREWATASFPDEFTKFEKFVRSSKFTLMQFSVRADTDEPSLMVNGLRVGVADSDGAPIYAWKGPESVWVGHEYERLKIEPHAEITDRKINFFEPFCWVYPAQDEVGLARFEALLRYIRLTCSPANVLKRRISFFKEHFPGACREVVEHLASRANKTPTPTRQVPRTPRTLRSAAPVVSQRPITPSSPAIANDQHLRTVDQAITSFRAGLLAQIGAAQAASRRVTAAFDSTIQDLELELLDAQNEKNDLGTQSAELNTKLRSMESRLLGAEQSKKDSESERAGLEIRIQGLESKLLGAEQKSDDLEKNCKDLRGKIAAAEAKAIGAERDAEKWKERYEELRKDVLGAVAKQK